jgi:hypothetical protein
LRGQPVPRVPDTAAAALPGEAVVRRVAAAVVVELPDGSGGGILLNHSGVIATIQPVAEGWSNARIRWRDGRVSIAWVVHCWRGRAAAVGGPGAVKRSR